MNEEHIQKIVRAVVAALGDPESKVGDGEGFATDEKACCRPRAVVRAPASKGARCVCICGEDEEGRA